MQFPLEEYEWVEDIIEDKDGNIVILTGDDLPPHYYGGILLTKFSPTLELLARKGYTYQDYIYTSHIVAG